jgi:hypothetical protein
MPFIIIEYFWNTVTYCRYERVGCTQINTHGQSMLVRRSGHAGFGDLQQSHDVN